MPSLASPLSTSLRPRLSLCKITRPISTTPSFVNELKRRSDQIITPAVVQRAVSSRLTRCVSKLSVKLGERPPTMVLLLNLFSKYTLSTCHLPRNSRRTFVEPAQACILVRLHKSWPSQPQCPLRSQHHNRCTHPTCLTHRLPPWSRHHRRARTPSLKRRAPLLSIHLSTNPKRSLRARLGLKLLQKWDSSASLYRMMAAVLCRLTVMDLACLSTYDLLRFATEKWPHSAESFFL